MVYRFNVCPHCQQKIVYKIELSDIDTKQYPAPIYIHHKSTSCNKTSTFYMDSLLRTSYIELEKKPGALKTIETLP